METFPDDAINNDPRQQEKAEEVGLNFSDFLDSATDMQDFIAAKNKIKSMMTHKKRRSYFQNCSTGVSVRFGDMSFW